MTVGQALIVLGVLVVLGVFVVGGFVLNHERKMRKPPRFINRWPGI
jgi:hypothetical protein